MVGAGDSGVYCSSTGAASGGASVPGLCVTEEEDDDDEVSRCSSFVGLAGVRRRCRLEGRRRRARTMASLLPPRLDPAYVSSSSAHPLLLQPPPANKRGSVVIGVAVIITVEPGSEGERGERRENS